MGTSDPTSPDYVPSYDPSRDHRDLGHGQDFGADLYYMYRAGRLYFPAMAAKFSGWTTDLWDQAPALEGEVATAGSPPALTRALGVLDDLQNILRRNALALHSTGEALVHIADDFAATDARAADKFAQELRDHRDLLALASTPFPQPPSSTDPHQPHAVQR